MRVESVADNANESCSLEIELEFHKKNLRKRKPIVMIEINFKDEFLRINHEI